VHAETDVSSGVDVEISLKNAIKHFAPPTSNVGRTTPVLHTRTQAAVWAKEAAERRGSLEPVGKHAGLSSKHTAGMTSM